MMGKDNEDYSGEPVCAPLIRCEATLHLAPAFAYLDATPFGEAESVPLEPMTKMSAQFASPLERLESLFLRPRMYLANVDNLRDLLIFVEGVCRGLAPPGGHSFQGEGEFADHVNKRFHQSPGAAWTTTLLNAFSDRPFFEACGAIAEVIRDWKASNGKS